MSEICDNKEQNQLTAFDVVVTALAILVFLPVLPFNVTYIFLILKTNRRENVVLFGSLALITILCGRVRLFFEETTQIAVMLVKGLLNHNFAISSYGQYSLTSWFILIAFSFVVASLVVKRIRRNKSKEEAGIISLERKS